MNHIDDYHDGYNDYMAGRPYCPPDNEIRALDYLNGYVDAHESEPKSSNVFARPFELSLI